MRTPDSMSPHVVLANNGRTVTQVSAWEDRNRHHSRSSLLGRHSDDEVHDMICVGFGPASLAIAVALHDALEAGDGFLNTENPKVRFLERQDAFAWHAGMLLPGTKMQITFIKDLATMRNPRSKFTFLNYLHEKQRLAAFTNLGTFLPQRIEYEAYMRWAADHFQDVTDYNMDAHSVRVGSRDPRTGAADTFEVVSTDKSTGIRSTIRARNIVIATGGKPSMPAVLPADHPRIIHSSQYATRAKDFFASCTTPPVVAVIGAGQSAAEVFHDIPRRFAGAKANLLIRGAALRPSDDSPFVNEIFDPEKVDDFYSREADLREKSIALDKATNYGVVRLELLDELYAQLYSQRVQIPEEADWPLRILNYRDVVSAVDIVDKGRQRLRLQVRNDASRYGVSQANAEDTLDVDLIVVGSGYVRNAHEDILRDLQPLRPDEDAAIDKWTVNRDYSVQFKDHALSSDAGIWLQGCNEMTHGLSDTLLSILAIRGGEMVDSIFGRPGGFAGPKLNGCCNGHA